MPYAFIWASFTLRDPKYLMSRWTNSCVEKFAGVKKYKEKSHLNILPAEYILKSNKFSNGNCIDYITQPKKK